MFGTVVAVGAACCGAGEPDFDVAAATAWDPAFLAAVAPRFAADDTRWRFEAGAFYEGIELGTVRQDDIRAQFGQNNSSKVGETSRGDVDRRRAGVQLASGSEAFRIEGQFFNEGFELADHFNLFGGSIGVEGQPRLGESDSSALILDFGAAVYYAQGDGDVPFLDQSSGQVFDVEGDMSYWESIFRLGLGFDVGEFQLTGGALYEELSGLINLTLDDDMEFESFGWAGYLRAAWRPTDLPMYVGARGYVRDYTGFMAEVGFRL